MVQEVNALRQKIVEAPNEAKLPPIVAALVLDNIRAELKSLVDMQAAAEAVADATPAPAQEKEVPKDGAVQSKQ